MSYNVFVWTLDTLNQTLAVDVIDKTDSNYLVEAAMHAQPDEGPYDQEAAVVQFRRGAYVQARVQNCI